MQLRATAVIWDSHELAEEEQFMVAASALAVGKAVSISGGMTKLLATAAAAKESPPAWKKFSVGSRRDRPKASRNRPNTLPSDAGMNPVKLSSI